jgi:hypothetical protein
MEFVDPKSRMSGVVVTTPRPPPPHKSLYRLEDSCFALMLLAVCSEATVSTMEVFPYEHVCVCVCVQIGLVPKHFTPLSYSNHLCRL